MKTLIKKLLIEGLLHEKLTNVDVDVNLLYIKYFEYDVNELERTGIIRDDMFIQTKTNTTMLTSEECIEANKTNSCVININIGSNYYKPSGRVIAIGVNDSALNYVKDEYNGNLKLAIDGLHDINQKGSLSREFTEEKIKGSIHHELAHWIDDTLHNGHINKRLNKSMEVGTRNLNGVPVNATKMEIQGQIHNIKQLYNKYTDIWDTISFQDMINYSPPLRSINNNLTGNTKIKWLRDLKTRMHREGLLGKNMK